MSVWDDGRSGKAGRIAGNAVLAELEQAEGPVQKLKGTIFETANAVLIGRVCSSTEYLAGDLVHWANVSWDQHRNLAEEAKDRRKQLDYLFITASSDPPAIRVWRVPGDTIKSYLADRGKKARRETCALHIVEEEDRHLIGRHDVTAMHTSISMGASTAAQLRDAISPVERSAAKTAPAPTAGRHVCVRPAGAYEIPLSSGRVARLAVAVPIAPSDVDRLKGWIDLMADVLTETEESDAEQWSRMIRQQVAAGLKQLDRGEMVDGEAAFARHLGELKPQRATGS